MLTVQPEAFHNQPAPLSADSDRSVIDVSILVVTWNSAPWIERCLSRIPAACDSLRYEIVLVDNGSRDDSALIATATGGSHLRVLRSVTNLGFAGGMNLARSESRGRFVFLLNPDCDLSPGSISTLIRYLEANPEVAAAVPLLLDEAGFPQRGFQLRRLPTLRSLCAEALLVDKILPESVSWNRHRYVDLDLERAQPVEQPAAAAIVIRRLAMEQVGELDERFFPAWFEDVDYCRRMAALGLPIHLVPAARGTHHVGSSLHQLTYPVFLGIWYRNLFRYAEKWFAPPAVEILRWCLIVGMAMRIVAVILGLEHRQATRREAIATYKGIMSKAFNRWNEPSPRS